MAVRSTLRIVTAALAAPGLLATLLVAPCAARPVPRGERFAQNWQELSPNDRQRALENLKRYQRLPESSRERMDRSYESWRQLDPGERARVQRNYEKYRQMTPDQRRDFESKYKRWKSGKDK